MDTNEEDKDIEEESKGEKERRKESAREAIWGKKWKNNVEGMSRQTKRPPAKPCAKSPRKGQEENLVRKTPPS